MCVCNNNSKCNCDFVLCHDCGKMHCVNDTVQIAEYIYLCTNCAKEYTVYVLTEEIDLEEYKIA